MIRTGFGLNCAHISHCFAGVYHNAISELCKGLTITLESVTSPHVLRFAGFDHRRERRRLEYAFLTNGSSGLVLGAYGRFIIASTPCFCVGIGDQHSGVLLDCSKSSRQCSLSYLLTYYGS